MCECVLSFALLFCMPPPFPNCDTPRWGCVIVDFGGIDGAPQERILHLLTTICVDLLVAISLFQKLCQFCRAVASAKRFCFESGRPALLNCRVWSLTGALSPRTMVYYRYPSWFHVLFGK